LQSTLPAQIKTRGDEVMIGQVFSNLISNALKFTPAHGQVSIDLFDSKEDQWIMAIKDSGTGIPKDDFKKLFKIEEKYTRKGLDGEEGTGLGLSVVHEIVKKHAGSITVESEVGKGTTFFVRFPKLMDNLDQSVMIVDDDEGVRVLHSRYLKRMFPESRIIQASDGKEALELAKRYRPKIIVTDYSMPEMNGFEFLNLLRQEETTKGIPVFVITGKDSTASMEAMRLSGAAAVLTKPISSAQLQEAIDKVMADRV
jgi:CheY-like chemotaxis protein